MYLEADIEIGNEQAKTFAQYIYDDFIEYMKSRDEDINKLKELQDKDVKNIIVKIPV